MNAERRTAVEPASGARLGAYELLDVLGRGATAVVHRGRHVGSGEAAAVKRLFVDDPADLEGLRREIDILGRLRHPGIVRVLAHGIEQGTPWYAMELVDGAPLDVLWAAAPATPTATMEGLRVLQRLCLTLAFLHGEGLVHRDLKPANVVVRGDGTPVLVDFAFAATFAARTGREVLERGGEFLGSLAYMSPEQLRGEFVDARADLYALGCMLYEAVTGEPPFTGSVVEVARAHLESPPAPPVGRAGALPPSLSHTILALLAKTPRERPGYAADVARQLAELLGEPVADPAATAYLYRATFVGRDAALAHLGACLDRAVEGRTVCAMVAGESGVGKTRLAMEFTRTAVLRHFAVVTGDCLPPGDGGGVLQPLRPLLRQLGDACRRGGAAHARRLLGGRAAVLAAVEPALAGIPGLEDETPPAPLPAAAARDRLLRALVDAVAEWALDEPLLVALDDLQWADELTLAALGALIDRAPASPLFVLGTLRSEEEGPALRALGARPSVTRLALGRVDRDAIGAIVGDMLAMQPAPATLVDFIVQHTEGNPFFVSEYLRTAVGAGLLIRTDGGGWQPSTGGIGYASLGLPRTLRELVERRLHDLHGAGRALVEAAAVLGRDFDPALAGALAGLDTDAQVAALAELRARQVADAGGAGRWRFAHDKLREVAYAVLSAPRRQALHGAAAATLAARVAAGDWALAATVAHHYDAAGDAAGAAPYHGRAGEQALAGGALDAARAHLNAALRAATAATPTAERARWWRLIAEATAGTDLGGAITATHEALRALGHRAPTGLAGWGTLIGAQLARRLRPPRARDRLAASEAAQAANRAATSFYFQFDIVPGVASSLRCINFADAAGEPGRAALAYAQIGYVAGGARLHSLAARCFARAYALRDVGADPSEFAAALYFHAMYEMGFGRWAASRTLAEEAVARLRDIGNDQEAEVAATVMSNTLYFAGALREAEERAAWVRESADRRGHAQHGAWGQFLVGRSRLALGDVRRARDDIERGYERLLPTRDFVSLVMCQGLLAKARWVDGDAAGASASADALDALLAARRMVPLAQCLNGYGALADVRLRLWARRGDAASAAAAERATAVLRRFARLYPIAAPAAARAAARRAWLLKRRRRARLAWARSVRLAVQLAMPFDEALARLDLARVDGSMAEAARATALLEGLGCAAAVATSEASDL